MDALNPMNLVGGNWLISVLPLAFPLVLLNSGSDQILSFALLVIRFLPVTPTLMALITLKCSSVFLGI